MRVIVGRDILANRKMGLIVGKLILQPSMRFATIAVAVALLSVSTAANSRTPAPGGRGQSQGQGVTAPAAAAAPAAGSSTRGPAPGVRGAAPGARQSQHAHSPSRSHSHRVQPPAHYRSSRAGVFWSAPIIAAPWWHYPDPYFAYGPAYHPPAVPQYEEPLVYIEQPPAPAVAAPAASYWHYCEDSKTYFPYVQTCVSPWLRVIPHAPPP